MFIAHRSSLIVLLLLVSCFLGFLVSSSLAQNQETTLAANVEYVSGTNYFLPNDLASSESGWLVIDYGTHAATNWSVFVKLDSGSTSTTVTLELFYGYTKNSDTLRYQQATTSGVVMNRSFAALSSWAQGWQFEVPGYLARRHAYALTVSAKCRLSVKEIGGR